MEKLSKDFSSWMQLESDHRVDDWFLMSSPFSTIAICAIFLVSSKFLHIWMKDRKAISIYWPIWLFDLFHLFASATFFVMTVKMKLLKDFNFK
jgi:hypothetical protein